MSFNGSEQLKREFKLPLVAGTTCGEEMLRRNFKKKQIFGAKTDKTGPPSEEVPAQYTNLLGSTNGGASNLDGSLGSAGGSPSKLDGPSLTGKVLRFYGYTREAVQESNVEKERVRKITLCYFLEDGTISVSEPKAENSGFAFQGTLVKRHVIPDVEGRAISFDTLAVGNDISFYGRTYVIVDCDNFTREFYSSVGVTLAAAEEIPLDAHTDKRSRPPGYKAHDCPSIASTSALNISLSREQISATKQFLSNDRQVLRCDCTWNDTKNLYGETHYLTLYYFIADDTIAVVEKEGVNCGRDPFPNFVRRQRIPKPRDESGKYENHNSSLTLKGKDKNAVQYYSEADIRIGNVLHIFGRATRICDYDVFTQTFLKEKAGVTEYKPIDISIPMKPKVEREPPPYNGFGDEQDSLGSCKRLDIKPPRKDGSRFAEHGNNVVKFAMKLENAVAADDIRRFVLSCFLADDTICIFEPVQRNSGIVGGKFLQRQKVTNKATGKPFVAADFFVGLHIIINEFPFICTATDERSMNYMETNPSTFSHSDVGNVIHKIKAMLLASSTGFADSLYNLDKSGNPVDFQELSNVAAQLKLPISEQEILSILRFFSKQDENYMSYEEFIAHVLPEGAVVGRDSRTWQEIHSHMTSADLAQFKLTSVTSEVDQLQQTEAAARAASQFLVLYSQRPTLFNQEFKFALDYAADSKIGEREFKLAAFDKLNLPLNRADVDALCNKIFPASAKRISFDMLHRLFNGTSNQPYNFVQLKNAGKK